MRFCQRVQPWSGSLRIEYRSSYHLHSITLGALFPECGYRFPKKDAPAAALSGLYTVRPRAGYEGGGRTLQ